MKGLIKFWTLSLGVAVAFMLTACGGESKRESLMQERVKDKWGNNARLLNSKELSKKFGFKDGKCFVKGKNNYHYGVVDGADNKLDNSTILVEIMVSKDNPDTFDIFSVVENGVRISIETLKTRQPECFN